MPDGSERKAKSWETSPMDVAKDVSKSLSERIVIAKVCLFLFTLFHFNLCVSFFSFFDSRWTASCGIWIDHLRSLASSSYLILNIQKVNCRQFFFLGELGYLFLTHFIYVRKKGFLAFFCSCSRRGCRETLWLSSMSRSPD